MQTQWQHTHTHSFTEVNAMFECLRFINWCWSIALVSFDFLNWFKPFWNTFIVGFSSRTRQACFRPPIANSIDWILVMRFGVELKVFAIMLLVTTSHWFWNGFSQSNQLKVSEMEIRTHSMTASTTRPYGTNYIFNWRNEEPNICNLCESLLLLGCNNRTRVENKYRLNGWTGTIYIVWNLHFISASEDVGTWLFSVIFRSSVCRCGVFVARKCLVISVRWLSSIFVGSNPLALTQHCTQHAEPLLSTYSRLFSFFFSSSRKSDL